ncbi:MAG: DUF115 domain-containing protein, partial [Spirochaetaceae bacterium]|nr:DUF115 domain-containing protein [Spirochaetaceae bacterium]
MKDASVRYTMMKARSGLDVPALTDRWGALHPLHSLVDPRREGTRLAGSLEEGFLVFLGLGGAFHIEAALENKNTRRVIIIEHNKEALGELLAQKEALLGDRRVTLLVDSPPSETERFVLNEYNPLLYGALRIIPLRTRVAFDREAFDASAAAVESALKKTAADFSVQFLFGIRWFSNILRNLEKARTQGDELPELSRTALVAAGPSLDSQLSLLKKERKSLFVLASDTSLPALLASDILPDGVISIDCQHISYHHFMAGLPRNIPLFLDLSSPPVAASLSDRVIFCAGGHPLARYIARTWKALPALDTSGGNVSYAALSLAHTLGAQELLLFGADFSYPEGRSYAGGTWLYPYFRFRENRFRPLEGSFSSLLYRGELKKTGGGVSWYYETPPLISYREHFEELAASLPLSIRAVPGKGAPLRLPARPPA